ncbi:calcium-binding protein [Pseudomonas hamedanensis]|uniref:Calcium-binding protein n=1 Tax=Pseudomonas hamedanensis TaxID=2745504 RepID=A0A9E6TII8_9PSED|nr:calcium-binding protein [Pseudomonas hamedanensis]QXI19312.1 calcium-binding protein [Pseudomonas hamedanensis]
MSVVNGTREADVLSGTDSNDQLYGLESDDVLIGSAGNDVLDGGEGFDTATYYAMSSGINVELGNAGTTASGPEGKVDTLIGVEKIFGTFHNDTFASSVGGVTLEGSAGDDLYIVDSEGVTIIEEDYLGYDELRTSLNTMKMDPFIEKLTFTGTGDFKAYGNASDNEIIGGAGNDWLWGGDGADHFVGGEGYDTVSYSDSLEGVRVEDFTNYDGLTIAYGDMFTGIEAIKGSGFDDVIYRHHDSMVIDGADGYDTVVYRYAFDPVNVLVGQGVNAAGDTLLDVEKVIGSSSADRFTVNASGVTVAGGGGDDVYTIDSTDVTVEEDADFMGGTDHVYTSLSELKLSAFVENLTYTGTGDFTGYGNDEGNTIVSGAGNDVLSGGAGGDRFEGGAGIDIVSYGDSTEGLSASLKWGLQSGIALYDTYIDIEGLRGSQYDDVLEGEWGNNVLEGGAGDDRIYGDDGNDYIYGGLASGLDAAGQSDTLSGGAGDDVIVDARDSLFTRASGGEGNDVLTGAGSHYTLFGDEGNDVLILNLTGQSNAGGTAYGGQGDDTYIVNTSGLVTIKDEGLDLNDTLILNAIANVSQLNVARVGDDAYLHNANGGGSGVPDNGVKLLGWYAGGNTIEHLQTADGHVFELPVGRDGFAMFG